MGDHSRLSIHYFLIRMANSAGDDGRRSADAVVGRHTPNWRIICEYGIDIYNDATVQEQSWMCMVFPKCANPNHFYGETEN